MNEKAEFFIFCFWPFADWLLDGDNLICQIQCRSDRGNCGISCGISQGTEFYLLSLWVHPGRPNTKDYDLFEDRATPTTTEAMLEMAVERLRGDFLEDVHSNTVWTGSFSLWLVWQKQVSASGIVMANGPASEVSAETAESL